MQVNKQQLEPHQIGKGCILSRMLLLPYLFNVYAEYIMRAVGLDETQARIKIARRNINNSDMQMTPSQWKKENRSKKAS